MEKKRYSKFKRIEATILGGIAAIPHLIFENKKVAKEQYMITKKIFLGA